MAKKRQTPRPPVQAPRRRESPRPGVRLPQRGRPLIAAGFLAVVVVVVVAAFAVTRGGSASSLPLEPVSAVGPVTTPPAAGKPGPEVAPIPSAPALAPAGALEPGQTVDGISCQPIEQLAYHIHAHLTIFVGGKQRLIPDGIGIAPPRQGQNTTTGFFVTNGSCFAWLHTHASDGIIHIESPSAKTYTLGDFFAVWHEPLGPNRVGPATGRVVAFYDGKVYDANPSTIPLRAHAQIQLDVGKPLVGPEQITFPSGL